MPEISSSSSARELSRVLRENIGVIAAPSRSERGSDAAMFKKYALDKYELNKRAEIRKKETEIRRQYNLEQIAGLALADIRSKLKPGRISVDWLNYFATCAQDVSDPVLQTLWARVLLKEAARPTSVSRRTLSMLRDFSAEDYRRFLTLLSYVFRDVDRKGFLVFWSSIGGMHYFDDVEGISFEEFFHLSSIHILTSIENTGYVIGAHEIIRFRYFDKEIIFSNPSEKPVEFARIYLVSEVGYQLADIAYEARPDHDFFSCFTDALSVLALDFELKERG